MEMTKTYLKMVLGTKEEVKVDIVILNEVKNQSLQH